MAKDVLIIVKTSPSRTPKVFETLRIAVAMIGMDMIPTLLFCCDGVYCLMREEGERSGEYEDYLKAVADLAGVHVLSRSLEERTLRPSDLKDSLNPHIISQEEASRLISESDLIFAL